MQFGRASDWHEQKYGRKAHTPWRKVNLSIDPDMNVHAVSVTETTVSDTEAMDAVLAVDYPVDRVIADGAYYSIERAGTWSACRVLPVIPPPAHAVIHGESHTRWHDRIVGYIERVCVSKKIRLWVAFAGRGADLAYQAMYRFTSADTQTRITATRERDHCQSREPVEQLRQTHFHQDCIVASATRCGPTLPNKAHQVLFLANRHRSALATPGKLPNCLQPRTGPKRANTPAEH